MCVRVCGVWFFMALFATLLYTRLKVHTSLPVRGILVLGTRRVLHVHSLPAGEEQPYEKTSETATMERHPVAFCAEPHVDVDRIERMAMACLLRSI